ncbi:MAG: hypothetical protein IH961_03235 [Chloroflexi bacterium]|nr:hypothetical protein [Chloroflexota bacterium]
MGQSPKQSPHDVYRHILANLDQSKIGSIALGMESLQLLAPGLPVAPSVNNRPVPLNHP